MRQFSIQAMAALAAAALSACGGGSGDGSPFMVVDMVRPTVSYVTPTNNDAAAPNNATLTVTFSEPMKPESLRSAISLVNARDGSAVPLDEVAYDVLNKIATVTPHGPLAGQDSYRAVVSAAATDLSGNTMAADYGWVFTAAGAPDTVPPAVSSVSPPDGASGVTLPVVVALSFSEAMNVRSLDDAFRLEASGTRIAGRLSYVGQAAVFTPDAPLAPNTAYTATLGTAATDLAGNALSAPRRWTFTTGAAADTTPPAVLGVTPAPGASGVPADSLITVAFDGPIQPILFGTIDGFVTPIAIDYATNTMTVRPTTRLRSGITYTSRVAARDLAGNVMGEAYVWSFTIAP